MRTFQTETITIDEATECLIDYRGRTPPKTSDGVRLITAKIVKGGRILRYPREFIAAEFYDKWMRRGFPKALDVLVTTEAPLGEVAILRNGDRIALAQRIILLRAKPQRVDPVFLYYALQSDQARNELRARASGTTVSGIRQSELRKVRIPIFSQAVQRKIAQILWPYDTLVENNRERIEVLERIARLIYREWFVEMRFGHYAGDKTRFLTCSDGTLGDLCRSVKERFEESRHSDWPLLDLSRIPTQSLAPEETGQPSELTTSRIVFRRGDTLFGAIRPYLHKVIAAPFDGVSNASVLVLRPQKPEYRALVALVASDPDAVRWADAKSTGTKMPVVSWSVLKTMPVQVPTIQLARVFEDRVGPLLNEIGLLAIKNRALRRTRDLLLPRLLSGRVEIGANGT